MPMARAAPGRAPSTLPSDAHALFATPFADRIAAAALALLPGVGPVRWRALLVRAGGDPDRAASALGVPRETWLQARSDASRHQDACAADTRFLVAGDPTYPRALLDLADAPPLLWVRGDVGALAVTPRVAMVGTREHTATGANAARRLVAALGDSGACVVSGMARGIDGIVHDAALRAGLPTVAVLGTGVDVAYPAQHRALYARIVANGAVVSEQPPGTTAVPGAFPRRNRIVAALADCTLVIEAGERSGALITADLALELGRTVAAVPGAIDSPTAMGSNALLRDGAHVIAAVEDLPPLLGLRVSHAALPSMPERSRDAATSRVALPPPELGGDERTLWDALAQPALDADVAATRAGLSARCCAAALAGLELRGAVTTELTGVIRRL